MLEALKEPGKSCSPAPNACHEVAGTEMDTTSASAFLRVVRSHCKYMHGHCCCICMCTVSLLPCVHCGHPAVLGASKERNAATW